MIKSAPLAFSQSTSGCQFAWKCRFPGLRWVSEICTIRVMERREPLPLHAALTSSLENAARRLAHSFSRM
jgi:hypothetical protein